MTDAARHDSQEIGNVLDPYNTSGDVWADSAYRSAEIEALLAEDGYRSQVHRRATRGHLLGTCAKAANTKRSRVRARAKAKIGMVNLAYNMSRHVTLLGMSTFEAYNG